ASLGHVAAIPFDAHQRSEILLTLAQAWLGFLLLVNLEFAWYEAVGLFVLWFVQFVAPETRHAVTVIYFAWAPLAPGRMAVGRRRASGFRSFPALWRHGVHRG